VYLAISLRNVGSGIGVCQGWIVRAGFASSRDMPMHAPQQDFRVQTRDLYVPACDIGMWQGALRNPDDPVRAAVAKAIDAREPFSVELLYSDQVGLQRTITRFGVFPAADSWLASVARHWYLDWDGPRPERDVRAAAEAIRRDQEAAERRQANASSQRSGAWRASWISLRRERWAWLWPPWSGLSAGAPDPVARRGASSPRPVAHRATAC
jgi:hypothetical protein